jgi:DNA-binding CsgD family transcriptional regulator/predicted DNA-binding protein YlxM (UPF0122 family)
MTLFKIEDFANMLTEAVYVIDFEERRFRYVSKHSLFCIDHTPEEIMEMGYDYYKIAIHPDDIKMWLKILEAIQQRLQDPDKPADKINYFSCTFRIKAPFSNGRENIYLTVHHKLKPILCDRAVRFGLCMLSTSVIHNIGNLRTYYEDSLDYDEYTRGFWKRFELRALTSRERSLLMLAGEGKTIKEIANVLNVSPKTIQNTESSLFEKLCVHSMRQAFIYAQNHQMIYVSQPLQPSELSKTPNKKTRRRLTNEMITYIQHGIDDGFSINRLAKEVDITEGSIRYAVKQGKLKKSVVIRKNTT